MCAGCEEKLRIREGGREEEALCLVLITNSETYRRAHVKILQVEVVVFVADRTKQPLFCGAAMSASACCTASFVCRRRRRRIPKMIDS